MSFVLKLQKAERTKLRRLPFLPRLGVTLEGFGHQLSIKQVPLLETLVNLRERGFSLANWRQVVTEAADEIRFPSRHAGLAEVKELRLKGAAPTRQRKAPLRKAATAKKKAEGDEAAPPA